MELMDQEMPTLLIPVFMSLLIYVRVYIAQSSVFMSLLVNVRVYIVQSSVFMSLLIKG
jgi:hypothetical protein